MLVLVCACECSTKLERARHMAMSDKRECPDYRSSDNRNCTVTHKNAVQRSQTAEFVFITVTIPV